MMASVRRVVLRHHIPRRAHRAIHPAVRARWQRHRVQHALPDPPCRDRAMALHGDRTVRGVLREVPLPRGPDSSPWLGTSRMACQLRRYRQSVLGGRHRHIHDHGPSRDRLGSHNRHGAPTALDRAAAALTSPPRPDGGGKNHPGADHASSLGTRVIHPARGHLPPARHAVIPAAVAAVIIWPGRTPIQAISSFSALRTITRPAVIQKDRKG